MVHQLGEQNLRSARLTWRDFLGHKGVHSRGESPFRRHCTVESGSQSLEVVVERSIVWSIRDKGPPGLVWFRHEIFCMASRMIRLRSK